ncbi:Hypothetical predicted protein, partial [Paramuricea clavata]
MHSPLRDVVVHSWKVVTQVFDDKNNQKQVFAYGVNCEVDELLLPEHYESSSSCCFDEDESYSEQEIEDENETTSESSEAECKDEKSECRDG